MSKYKRDPRVGQMLQSFTVLVKVTLTLIWTVVSFIPCEMCVQVACWFLCVEHNSEQVETIL